MEKIRLNKALQSLCSRRQADKLIFEGRVRVGGVTIQEPGTQVALDALIEVDGKKLSLENKVYFILNKPAGYICSAREGNSKRVLDLFAHCGQRLFTVGRLDRDTKGLLLVTNDGEFANKIAHPSCGIAKEYLVKVAQEVSDEHLRLLTRGTIVQGSAVRPLSVKKMRRGTIKIVVGEGKKHEVRQMIADCGLTLLDLTRIRIGPFTLGTLAEGSYRSLSPQEIVSI